MKKAMYHYIVDIHHYTGNGVYSYTETMETGDSADIITADSWVRGCKDNNISIKDDGDDYAVIGVDVYNLGDDPMIAYPVLHTATMEW